MRIIILHGDDTEKSYVRLKKFINVARERSWEVVFLDDSNLSIEESLASSSLFGNERFFILRAIKKLGKTDFDWLRKRYKDLSGNLVVYNEGQLTQAEIKSFQSLRSSGQGFKIEEYKLPVFIWNFLDGLYPGNAAKSVKLLHKVIEKQAPEFIFTLIAKLFRDLYWVKVDPVSIGYPSWRISKLKSQSAKFTKLMLTGFIDSLATIDIKVKTSKADLVSALDLLIIKQLE